jgi:hypothetical protein
MSGSHLRRRAQSYRSVCPNTIEKGPRRTTHHGENSSGATGRRTGPVFYQLQASAVPICRVGRSGAESV